MATGPAGQAASMTDESDANLLVYMTMRDEDLDGARAAWGEFYRRHAPYLAAVCQRAYGRLLSGPSGAADLVAETFRKAFLRAETFTLTEDSDDVQRLRIRAWLGVIARRLMLSILRSRGRSQAMVALEEWHQPARSDEAELNASAVARVREALETLPDRQQHILRVTMQYYDPSSGTGRLPGEVLADLAKTLNTTPENIRQLRRRALMRLREVLSSTSPGCEGAP